MNYTSKQKQIQFKRKRVRRLLLFAAAVILFIGALVFVLASGILGGSSRRLKALPMNHQSQFSFTGDGFVYIQNGALSYVDLRDSSKDWSVTLNAEAEGVKLVSSKTVCAIYNQMTVFFMDNVKGQKLFSRDYVGAVELVRCATQYVGILRRDESQSRQLFINGLTGNDADEIRFTSNIEVLDFGFFGPNDTLWTLTLDTAGVSPSCKLETYAIKTKTGVMSVEGQLVERVEFLDKSTYIIGTSHVIAFNDLGKEDYRQLIYGWKYADFGVIGNKPVLIVTPRGTDGVTGSAKLITLPDREQLLQLPSNTRGIFVAGGKIVVVTSGALLYYSDKGELLSEQPLDILVDSVRKLSDTQLMLTRGNEEFLVTIS